MSAILKVELTPEAQQKMRGLQALPARLVAAIAKGMDKANHMAVGQIQTDHLIGKGPFPPEQHKLGTRSSLLLRSVTPSPAIETAPGKIESAIGSNLVYAAIHEFGGRIRHEAREMKVRHQLDKRGCLVKQLKNSNLLMFARKGATPFRETTVQARAYDVNIPERAPIRTGLKEARGHYTREISAAIVAAWRDSLK